MLHIAECRLNSAAGNPWEFNNRQGEELAIMSAAKENCPDDILKTLLGFFSLPQHISNLLHVLLLYYLSVIMTEILITASVWDIEKVKV